MNNRWGVFFGITILVLVLMSLIDFFWSQKEKTVIPSRIVYNGDLTKGFIHDTIHDTVYHWNLDTSRMKFKRIKLLCIDSYSTEGLKEGEIYTTKGEISKDEDGVWCYYIDGIGSKRASRFTKLIQ